MKNKLSPLAEFESLLEITLISTVYGGKVAVSESYDSSHDHDESNSHDTSTSDDLSATMDFYPYGN